MDFVTLTDQFGQPYTYDTIDKVFEIFIDLGCFDNLCTISNFGHDFYMFVYKGGVSSAFQTCPAKAPFSFDSQQDFCLKLQNLLEKVFAPFVVSNDAESCYPYQTSVNVLPNSNEQHGYFFTVVLFFRLHKSIAQNIAQYFEKIADSTGSATTNIYYLD